MQQGQHVDGSSVEPKTSEIQMPAGKIGEEIGADRLAQTKTGETGGGAHEGLKLVERDDAPLQLEARQMWEQR